jgi:hypothetical protein
MEQEDFPCGDCELGQSSVAKFCIQSIGRWLLKNNLCFNGPKTEFMAISSTRRIPSISYITVDGARIQRSDAVRALGAWLDTHVNMSVRVIKVCHSIGHIRKYLTLLLLLLL